MSICVTKYKKNKGRMNIAFAGYFHNKKEREKRHRKRLVIIYSFHTLGQYQLIDVSKALPDQDPSTLLLLLLKTYYCGFLLAKGSRKVYIVKEIKQNELTNILMAHQKFHACGCLDICIYPNKRWGFPGGLAVKDPPASVGDEGLTPGLGRPPGGGNGNPPQYPCLGNPMDRGA